MLESLFKRYDLECGLKGASCYRIFFALYALFFRNQYAYSWISEYPDLAFNPPMLSFSVVFHGFPPVSFFTAAELLIVTLYICLVFGFCTNAVSFLLGVLIIICNSFVYSFGKIDHGVLIEATLIIFSFSGWGAHYSLDSFIFKSKSKKITDAGDGYIFALLALTVSFAYFTAGIQKISWIDLKLGFSGVRWWVNTCYAMGRHEFLAGYFLKIKNIYFWELLDISAVCFEVSFLVAFLHPRYFMRYIGVAVCFHLANYLILNIPFVHHLVIFAAFLNWEKVVRMLDRTSIPKILWVLLFGVALGTPYILFLKNIPWPVIPDWFKVGKIQINTILIQFGIAVFIIIFGLWRRLAGRFLKYYV